MRRCACLSAAEPHMWRSQHATSRTCGEASMQQPTHSVQLVLYKLCCAKPLWWCVPVGGMAIIRAGKSCRDRAHGRLRRHAGMQACRHTPDMGGYPGMQAYTRHGRPCRHAGIHQTCMQAKRRYKQSQDTSGTFPCTHLSACASLCSCQPRCAPAVLPLCQQPAAG
jgi:hypothetical protein